MASRPVPVFSTPGPVAGAGLLTALLTGTLLAASPAYGIGLFVAVTYAPLVLVNLPLGLAMWVALALFDRFSLLWIAPTAAALLVLLAWFGTFRGRRAVVGRLLSRHRGVVASLVLFLVWASLSALWAKDPTYVVSVVWQWYVAAAVLLVVATTIESPAHLRMMLIAFVVGAVVSVTTGLVDVFSGAQLAVQEGRLRGGGGDANYLAAGLVPALILAGGLAAAIRTPILRWTMGVAAALITVGLAATQSRGGFIALAAAAVAALVLLRHRRSQIVAFGLVVVVAAGACFAASPAAWERVTDPNRGTTGRTDLLTIGWRMFRDHPVVGVGLNNFPVRAKEYVREPGTLTSVELIAAQRPQEEHNVPLGLLAETGVVGFFLYLGVVLGCLRAGLLAARTFEALGEYRLADLVRVVLVASFSGVAASMFIPNGADKRFWILLAIGPAMLAVAADSQERRPA